MTMDGKGAPGTAPAVAKAVVAAGAGADESAAVGAPHAGNPVAGASASCDLCAAVGGEILFAHPLLRVVLVDDPLYPAFCRVVWQEHVREMTDLAPAHRSLCMQVVCRVEQALRDVFTPHKINLASLGNLTPHLHWHVIPRFESDAHYPQPVWGQQQRMPDAAWLDAQRALLPRLRAAIAAQCATLGD